MSVTADTSQDPIVPCVASAAAWSAQNSASAAERVAFVAKTVADAAWAIASTPSRRRCPRGKAVLPIERDSALGLVARPHRACVDGSRGFRVPLASVCPAAAVDIGRSIAAAGGLGAGFVRIAGMAGRLVFGGPDGDQRNLWRIAYLVTKGQPSKDTQRLVTMAEPSATRVVSCYTDHACEPVQRPHGALTL
eukprot:scaffold32558_cov60-Phaeocystis_antarctica.AAC.2